MRQHRCIPDFDVHSRRVPAKPFVLTVKAVVLDEQGRCLLVRRSKYNRSFIGCWEWPGGKVEADEDFAMAVLRETKEETGLEIEITRLAGATQFEMPKMQIVLLCMEARVAGGKLRLSEEHDDAVWLPLGELQHRELPAPIREYMLDYASRRRA